MYWDYVLDVFGNGMEVNKIQIQMNNSRNSERFVNIVEHLSDSRSIIWSDCSLYNNSFRVKLENLILLRKLWSA